MIRDQEETDGEGAGRAAPEDAAGTSERLVAPGHRRRRRAAANASETAPGTAPPEAGPRPETPRTRATRTRATRPTPDEAHADEVAGDEPLLPARVHRPSDLHAAARRHPRHRVVLAIAAFAHGTTSGLEQDINKGTGQAPDLLIKIAGLASSIAILLVPVAFAIERLIKRDGLRIADGVLAAVLAHGVTLATDLWVAEAAPDSIQDALTQPSPGDVGPHRPRARLSRARHRLHDGRRHGPQTALARACCGWCCCSTPSRCWSPATPHRSRSSSPC